MELAVDQGHLDVDHRVPADHAVDHRLDDALLDRRDELVRDRAAEDLALVDEPLTVGEGLDLDRADGVLAVTTALFHVPTGGGRLAADRFPEGDLRGAGDDVDAELALEPLDHDLEVGLAHPVHHGLVGLLVSGDAQRGVLLTESREPGRQLVLLALGLRSDRVGEQRLGQARAARGAPARPSCSSVSPVWACCSLATAPMSPAETAGTDSCSLPR